MFAMATLAVRIKEKPAPLGLRHYGGFAHRFELMKKGKGAFFH
jgi:hypothetical protein